MWNTKQLNWNSFSVKFGIISVLIAQNRRLTEHQENEKKKEKFYCKNMYEI